MNIYAGKKAVVVGGTHGMGHAMVDALLDGGAEVVLTGRKGRNLDAARCELGARAHVVASDVASLNDIDALGAFVERELGQVDAVFVNAGYARIRAIADVTEAEYDQTFPSTPRARSSPCSALRPWSAMAARSWLPRPSPTRRVPLG